MLQMAMPKVDANIQIPMRLIVLLNDSLIIQLIEIIELTS